MTDVKRVGKEANFNQYLTERVGTFLVVLRAIDFDRQNRCWLPGAELRGVLEP